MMLRDILTADRIVVDRDGSAVRDKASALSLLARLLAPLAGESEEEVSRRLEERERRQSTGIGEGVAIPHASVDSASAQAAALLLCSVPVEFGSLDGAPVSIVFGVVGPRGATGEHLRALARISRLLRNAENRRSLLAQPDREAAYQLIVREDAGCG